MTQDTDRGESPRVPVGTDSDGRATTPPALDRPSLTIHGTPSRYSGGCRCDLCRAAHAAKMKAWRKRNGTYDTLGQNRATREAARRYADEHPAEWCALMYAERVRAQAERAGGRA